MAIVVHDLDSKLEAAGYKRLDGNTASCRSPFPSQYYAAIEPPSATRRCTECGGPLDSDDVLFHTDCR